jgi:hypothetical protein
LVTSVIFILYTKKLYNEIANYAKGALNMDISKSDLMELCSILRNAENMIEELKKQKITSKNKDKIKKLLNNLNAIKKETQESIQQVFNMEDCTLTIDDIEYYNEESEVEKWLEGMTWNFNRRVDVEIVSNEFVENFDGDLDDLLDEEEGEEDEEGEDGDWWKE